MKTLFFLIGFSILNLAVFSQSNADSGAANEVFSLNKRFDEASVKQDTAAMKYILADDYSGITAEGYAGNKNAALRLTPHLKFDWGRSVDVKVRMYENTAVVTGQWLAAGTYQGKPFKDNELYTVVFVKRKGHWQIVAEQQTAVRDDKH